MMTDEGHKRIADFLAKCLNNPETQAQIEEDFNDDLRVIDPLFEYLGDNVLFFPDELKSKIPREGIGHLQNKLARDYEPPGYWSAFQASILDGGNLSVLLGERSGNICTVDLDYQEVVEPFLKYNPRLRDTLISTGSGVGCQFWVRMIGWYEPKVLKLTVSPALVKKYDLRKDSYFKDQPFTGDYYDIGEWRGGQKSTIWGVHPSGNSYRLLNAVPVIEVAKMNDLRLPPGWRLRRLIPGVDFGPEDPTEDDLIDATRKNRAVKKWRGGGGSH